MSTACFTEERLRSWLDANQQDRERLCAAVLSLDPRFSRVESRRPKGGRDQGRDIEAVFENDRPAFGGVAFVNGANDSSAQKRRIKRKFREDLRAAQSHKPDVKVFVFFTNLDLTPSEVVELQDHARSKGGVVAEILHRERMRMALDSPPGFPFRYQYLGIKMSDEEQVGFFRDYGEQLQALMTRKFTDLDRSLERIEFLSDKASPLHWLQAVITLDHEYDQAELAPFRVLFQFRRRGSRASEPQFCVAAEDIRVSCGDERTHGFRLYVGTEQQQMYDLKRPFSVAPTDQLSFGGELLHTRTIPTLGELERHEIGVFISENLVSRLRSIAIIANIYEVARLEREDLYRESIEGPPWWPENPSWPELAPDAKDLAWVALSRSTGLPFPEYLPNVSWLLDFYARTPRRWEP